MKNKSSPESFRLRMEAIGQTAFELSQKPEFSERDIAIGAELYQRYIDILREIEESEIEIDISVTAKTDGNTIKFQNTDQPAAWISGFMD